MKVIICGAGQVGWQIARHLSNERNDVTVVDSDPDLVRRATDSLDVQGVAGYASYPNILDRAGARDADMIIAATHSDEVNMVTCQVAHSVFGINRKIARLRSQSYLDAIYSDLYRRDHMPIDVVISPEREVAAAALQRLHTTAAFDTERFMDGKAHLLGITIEEECPVVNTPLRQLTDLFSTLRAVVVGVRRDGTLFTPEAKDQLFVGDDCYVFAHVDDVPRTMEIFGKKLAKQERIVLVGGGNVGLAVASELEKRTNRVRTKIIEKNRKIAERAAEALERTIVLNGDGLDVALLHNPRATTVSSILRHIRHGRVRSVYSIGDAEAEVIEAEVLSTSPLAGRKIGEIEFPEGVLVGALRKGGDVIRPLSSTRIDEGDVIAIFSLAKDVPEVERLMQVSIDFF